MQDVREIWTPATTSTTEPRGEVPPLVRERYTRLAEDRTMEQDGAA